MSLCDFLLYYFFDVQFLLNFGLLNAKLIEYCHVEQFFSVRAELQPFLY